MTNEECMRRAIALSEQNIENGGGPFAAVIVKDGEIIAEGTNRVTADCDPTAHAEVSAIRTACKILNTFSLAGCTIFTSCEPCPMCLGAIYWAHLDAIYYGNNRTDAAEIGFDDEFIYKEIPLSLEARSIPMTNLLRAEALRGFSTWQAKSDKTEY
ncbi:MAG: nucleoside deaminase [Treponema sp.]|nr:nucleoside deaminase [Treponema sp.]